ncbi:MAG: sulfurtransferase [Roseiflexaceae bacterium]
MSISSLVNSTWLQANLHNPDVVVVDTRWYLLNPPQGQEEYLANHIAGAVYLSIDHDLSAEAWDGPGRHPLPKSERFIATMSNAGIDNTCHVVIYDSAGGSTATRLWWLLRYYGHPHVSILDGGWQAWVAAGGAVRSGNEARPARQFMGAPNHAMTVDAEQVDHLRHDQHVLLLDARAHERYTGAVEPFGPRAGHIPGALSAPFVGNLNADGTLKSIADLTTRYQELGAHQAQQVVCYCGSGVTATHDIFALHLAGIDAILYPGSWSDWSSQEVRPIATGEQP